MAGNYPNSAHVPARNVPDEFHETKHVDSTTKPRSSRTGMVISPLRDHLLHVLNGNAFAAVQLGESLLDSLPKLQFVNGVGQRCLCLPGKLLGLKVAVQNAGPSRRESACTFGWSDRTSGKPSIMTFASYRASKVSTSLPRLPTASPPEWASHPPACGISQTLPSPSRWPLHAKSRMYIGL